VRLILDAYPENEYGSVMASIKEISTTAIKIDKEYKYVLTVDLPKDTKTTIHKFIIFAPEMTAIANVITERKSILSKLLDQFLAKVN
jgi:hypothetical protein